MAAHFNNQISGYNIYSSEQITDYVDNGPSVVAPIGSSTYSQALGDPAVDRLHFRYQLGGVAPGSYIWVRPYCRTGEEGTASEWIQAP